MKKESVSKSAMKRALAAISETLVEVRESQRKAYKSPTALKELTSNIVVADRPKEDEASK